MEEKDKRGEQVISKELDLQELFEGTEGRPRPGRAQDDGEQGMTIVRGLLRALPEDTHVRNAVNKGTAGLLNLERGDPASTL